MIGDQTLPDPAVKYTQTRGEGLVDPADQAQLDIMRSGHIKTRDEEIGDIRHAQKHRDYLDSKNPMRAKRTGYGVTPPRNGGRRLIAPAPTERRNRKPVIAMLDDEPGAPSTSRAAKQGGFLPLLSLLAPVVAPIISRIFGSGKRRPPSAAAMKRYMKTFTQGMTRGVSGGAKHDPEYWETLRQVVSDALRDVIVDIFEKDEYADDEEIERITEDGVNQIIPRGFIKHAVRFYDDDGNASDKKGRGLVNDMIMKKHEFLRPLLQWETHKLLKDQYQGPERRGMLEKVREHIKRLPASHPLFKTVRGEGLFDWIKKGIAWVGQKVLPNLIPAVAKTVEGDAAQREAAAARQAEIEERRLRAEERRREEDLDRAARRRRQQEDDEFYAARRARDLPPPSREKLPRYEEPEEDEEESVPKPTKKAPVSKKKPVVVEASGRFKKKR